MLLHSRSPVTEVAPELILHETVSKARPASRGKNDKRTREVPVQSITADQEERRTNETEINLPRCKKQMVRIQDII